MSQVSSGISGPSCMFYPRSRGKSAGAVESSAGRDRVLALLAPVALLQLPIPHTLAAFTEAAIGLGMVALLITYLPTMYAAFPLAPWSSDPSLSDWQRQPALERWGQRLRRPAR